MIKDFTLHDHQTETIQCHTIHFDRGKEGDDGKAAVSPLLEVTEKELCGVMETIHLLSLI